MATKRKMRLTVLVDGKRRYVSVPSERAADLHAYLRKNGVTAAPPAPMFTGLDSIELTASVNTATVKELLNDWF